MERAYYLENEKVLSAHHRALRLDLERARALGEFEVAQCLEATLWHLGTAILETARRANAQQPEVESHRELPCVTENHQITVEELLDDTTSPDHRPDLSAHGVGADR